MSGLREENSQTAAGVGEGLGSELGVRCGAIGRGRAVKFRIC